MLELRKILAEDQEMMIYEAVVKVEQNDVTRRRIDRRIVLGEDLWTDR